MAEKQWTSCNDYVLFKTESFYKHNCAHLVLLRLAVAARALVEIGLSMSRATINEGIISWRFWRLERGWEIRVLAQITLLRSHYTCYYIYPLAWYCLWGTNSRPVWGQPPYSHMIGRPYRIRTNCGQSRWWGGEKRKSCPIKSRHIENPRPCRRWSMVSQPYQPRWRKSDAENKLSTASVPEFTNRRHTYLPCSRHGKSVFLCFRGS